MNPPPIRPTQRGLFDGDPRLIRFVNWLADQLDSDFDIVDYSFDGRDYVIDYADGSAIVFTVRVSAALHNLNTDDVS